MAKGITVPVTQTGLSQSIQNAVKQVGGISVPVDIDSRSFKNLSQPLGRITGLATEFEKSIAASNARVIAFGASVGIINGIQGAFAELLRTGIEVQKILADIAAISGQSGAELSKFGDSIFDVAKNTSQSFKVAAQAALEFSRQGLSTDETIQRTNDALTLVRFTTLNAAEAVDVLTAATNSFSETGITTSEILNKLVAVDTKFAVSAEDLANGLARAGSIAQEVGVSFDELNAAITITQERTARGGAVIGNALKTIFTRLRSDETVNALRSIGVESLNAQGGLKGAIPLLQEVATKIESLSGGERVQILEAIASKYNINILSALLNDLNAANGKFAEVVQISGSAQNQAYERQIELNKTLAAQINLTTVSVTQLFNKLAEIGVTESLTSILKFVNDLLDGFNKLLDSETTGGNIAKGLIKGISDIFFSVGLPIIGAIFIKLTKDIAQFGVESLKTILGINQQVRERQALEQAVVNTLIKDRDVMASILALSGNRAKQEEYLLNIYNRQISALERVQSIATSVAPALVQGGLSATSGTVKRRAADGYLPAQEAADVKRGVGGADKNAKVVKIPNFSFGGGKKGTMYANTSEYIVPNYNGGDGTAIFNKDMVRKYGKPENAKKINAATGYIPNFADGKYIYDSDRLPADKNALLKKILASNVKKNLILGPAGTGKTTFAAGGGTFITKPEDADKATEIDILSGAARTKDGGISANLESIISAVNVSGGKVSYLYAGNMDIIARRSGREGKEIAEGDLRSEKQIAGTKYAPLNQFDFIEKVKSKAKNFGIVKNAATGYIPNFQQEAVGEKKLSAKEKELKTKAEKVINNRVGNTFGTAAMLVKDQADEQKVRSDKTYPWGFEPKEPENKIFGRVKFPVYGLKDSGLEKAKLGTVPKIKEPLDKIALDFGTSVSSDLAGRQVSQEEYQQSYKKSFGAAGAFGGVVGGIFESAARVAFNFESDKVNTLDVPNIPDPMRLAFGITGGERSADLKGSVSDGVLRGFASQAVKNNLVTEEVREMTNAPKKIAAKGFVPNFAKKQKIVSAFQKATMLLPSEEEASKVNEQSLNLGIVPKTEESRKIADRVQFRAYGLSKQGLKSKEIENVPDVFQNVKSAISAVGARIVNKFNPLSEKINKDDFGPLFEKTEGAKGALSAVAGAVFETAIQKTANPNQNKKASNEVSTFDVASLTPELKTLFGITTPETFADYKISAATKEKFADQIIKNKQYDKVAARGYVPNYAEKLSEMYDWDGTIIPKISGKPEEYIQSIQKLEKKDLLPVGKELAASKEKFDIATARPITFKDPIKNAAQNLGLNVEKVFPLGSMFENRRTQGKRGPRKLYTPERKALFAEKTGRSIVDDEEENLMALGSRGINANLRNRGAIGFIPNFAEGLRQQDVLAPSGQFYDLDTADAFLAGSSVSIDPASPASKGLGQELKKKILDSARRVYGPKAQIGISRLPGQREAFTSAVLANPALADDFIALQKATTGGVGPAANTPDALAKFNNPTPFDPTPWPAIRATGGKARAVKKVGPRSLTAAFGFVPNFAGPLQEAVDREIAAGVKPSQVRVTRDDRLMTTRNPEGLAVINTRDEPNGKVPSNRINEKNGRKAAAAKAFIPNFADPASGKITAGLEKGPEIKSDEFRAFTREVDKIARTFAEANKSVEELNAAFPKLKEDIANSANKFKVGQKTQDQLIAASEKLKERTIQALSRPIGPVSVGTSTGPTLGPGVVPGTSAASAPAATAASPAIVANIAGAFTNAAKSAAGTITAAVAAGLAAAKGATTPPANPTTTTGNAASGGGNKDKSDKKEGFTLDKTFYAFSGLTLAANALEQAFGKSESAVAKAAVGLSALAQGASQGALLGQSFGDLAKNLVGDKGGILGSFGKIASYAGPIGAVIGGVIGIASSIKERANKEAQAKEEENRRNFEADIKNRQAGKTLEENIATSQLNLLDKRENLKNLKSELSPLNAKLEANLTATDFGVIDRNTSEDYEKQKKLIEEIQKLESDIALEQNDLTKLQERQGDAANQKKDQDRQAIDSLRSRISLESQILKINEAFNKGENARDLNRAKAIAEQTKTAFGLTEEGKRDFEFKKKIDDIDEKRVSSESSLANESLVRLKNSSALATVEREKLESLTEEIKSGKQIEDIEQRLVELGIEGSAQARQILQELASKISKGKDDAKNQKDILAILEGQNRAQAYYNQQQDILNKALEARIKNEQEIANIRREGAQTRAGLESGAEVAALERQISTQSFATREQEARLALLIRENKIRTEVLNINTENAATERNALEEFKNKISQQIDGLVYLRDEEKRILKERIGNAKDFAAAQAFAAKEIKAPVAPGDPNEVKNGVRVGDQYDSYKNSYNAFNQARTDGENLYKTKVDEANQTQRTRLGLISNEIPLQERLKKLREQSPAKAGMYAAFDEIRQESYNFQETFAKNTTLAFRDGMRDALSAAISQTDDLGSALQNVAINFLKTMQNAFLQQASNQAMIGLQNAFPTVFPRVSTSAAPANVATGGFVNNGRIAKGYATGGLVTGGSGYKDDVPAMLSQGEYVIRKSSVQKYGKQNLERLNSGEMPRLAAGGDIFLPGVRGGTAISGYKDITRFANQTTTSGSTDILRGGPSSAFINLEDQSAKLSRFALLNDDDLINQEVRSAQQQGLDLIKSRENYRTQKRKELQKQIVGTILSAALSAGLSQPKESYGLETPKAPKVPEGTVSVGEFMYPQGRAYGGMVSRYAAGGQAPIDNVPALLMGGEYVMSNQATKKYGKQFFDSINQGRAPRFAAGGEVGGGEMLGEKFDNLSTKLETKAAPEVNITINVTSSGASETKAEGSQQNQDKIDYKKMSERIKAVVLETINEEKRLGGSLRNR